MNMRQSTNCNTSFQYPLLPSRANPLELRRTQFHHYNPAAERPERPVIGDPSAVSTAIVAWDSVGCRSKNKYFNRLTNGGQPCVLLVATWKWLGKRWAGKQFAQYSNRTGQGRRQNPTRTFPNTSHCRRRVVKRPSPVCCDRSDISTIC